MIYVHVNPGIANFTPDAQGVRVFDVVRFWLVDSLGRTSVALLSVVAGYLAVYSLRRETLRRFTSKKVSSLLLPLLLWNGLFIVAAVAGNLFVSGHLESTLRGPLNLHRLPNLLLAITASPANEPLDFLRDVFVCSLLAPVLIVTLRRTRPGYAVLVALLAVLGYTTHFVHTPNILILYAAGIYVASLDSVPDLSRKLVSISWLLLVGLGLALAVLEIETCFGSSGYHASIWLDIGLSVIRLPAAVAFWALALRLSQSSLLSRLARLEPFIFTAFCCHLVVTTVVWVFWQEALGNYYDPAYPLFFFLIPFVVMIAAVVFAEAANRYARPMFSLLNGGRSFESASSLKQVDLQALRARIARQLPNTAT